MPLSATGYEKQICAIAKATGTPVIAVVGNDAGWTQIAREQGIPFTTASVGGMFGFFFHPGPRTKRPGFAPVCSPSFNTCTPFTNTVRKTGMSRDCQCT